MSRGPETAGGLPGVTPEGAEKGTSVTQRCALHPGHPGPGALQTKERGKAAGARRTQDGGKQVAPGSRADGFVLLL